MIPTFNRSSKLRSCIQSVLSSTSRPDEIIVVDDASTDDTARMVRSEFPDVQLIRHETETFAGGSINDGILASKRPYVLIIDDDNVIHRDLIRSLHALISSRPEIGVVGPITYWLAQPDVIMYTGAVYTRYFHRTVFVGANEKDRSQFTTPFQVTNIPNCFMLRREVAIQTGLIDADLFTAFGEDGSLQDKIALRGFKVFIEPSAKTFHDVDLRQRGDLSFRYTVEKIYYGMRTHTAHIRVFERSPVIRVARLASTPLYAAFYAFMGVRFSESFRGALAACWASLAGSMDGIRLRRGYYKATVHPIESGVANS